jgi:hypothetical protein
MQASFLGIYRAIVTSTTDPTNRGFIKVQCPQVSGTAELNWAEPANNSTVLPNIGDIVWVYFNGGETNKPVYSLTKNPYSWNIPVYTTGWAGAGSFAGLGGPMLRYRKTRDDELHVYGAFQATMASPSTTVFVLPSGFYNPLGLGMLGPGQRLSGGGTTPITVAVDVSVGSFIVSVVASIGDMFLLNTKIPMLFTP